MPDRTNTRSPATWGDAFSSLPLADPPDRWPAIAAAISGRRRRAIGWFASAATLVIAVALPWKLQHEPAPAPQPRFSRAHGELENLYAQSAQLEALLAYARDDRVASGSAVAVASRLEEHLVSIDAALAQPGLTIAQQRDLWRARVETLRSLATFESNRRLLSARGDRYDGALVRVD